MKKLGSPDARRMVAKLLLNLRAAKREYAEIMERYGDSMFDCERQLVRDCINKVSNAKYAYFTCENILVDMAMKEIEEREAL